MKNRTWTTRDGQVLKIKDMETDHIVNCIKMLRRGAERKLQDEISAGYNFLSGVSGEFAQDAIDSELNELNNMTGLDFLERRYEPYQWLLAELRKRKVTKKGNETNAN